MHPVDEPLSLNGFPAIDVWKGLDLQAENPGILHSEEIVSVHSGNGQLSLIFTHESGETKALTAWIIIDSLLLENIKRKIKDLERDPFKLVEILLDGVMHPVDVQAATHDSSPHYILVRIWKRTAVLGFKRIFPAADRKGSIIFWLNLSDNRLIGCDPLAKDVWGRRFEYKAHYAQSVPVLRPGLSDTIIFHSNGDVSLWTGLTQLISCSIAEYPRRQIIKGGIGQPLQKRRRVAVQQQLRFLSGIDFQTRSTLPPKLFSLQNNVGLMDMGQSSCFRIVCGPLATVANLYLQYLRMTLPAEAWEGFFVTFFGLRHSLLSHSVPVRDWDLVLSTVLYTGFGSSTTLSILDKVDGSTDESEWLEMWSNDCDLRSSDIKLNRATLFSKLRRLIISCDPYMQESAAFKGLLEHPEILHMVVVASQFFLEELKTNLLMKKYTDELAILLQRIATYFGWKDDSLSSQISRMFSAMKSRISGNSTVKLQASKPLPNLYENVPPELEAKKLTSIGVTEIPLLFNIPYLDIESLPINSLSAKVLKAYNNLELAKSPSEIQQCLSNFRESDIELMPESMSAGLRDAIEYSRCYPPRFSNLPLYELIGREDVYANEQTRVSSRIPRHCRDDFRLRDKVASLNRSLRFSGNDIFSCMFPDVSSDLVGFDAMERLGSLMFIESPSQINAYISMDMSPESIQVIQQESLHKLAYRIFASSLGKAIAFFQTSDMTLPEVLDIPSLVVSAIMPPLNTRVYLDPLGAPAELKDWPDFHNGISCALRLAIDKRELTSTWMSLNKPLEPTATYGGFLFGLGILGTLDQIENWRLLEYFSPAHDITLVGLLLGLSFSYRKREDIWLTKILSIHIPSLKPSNSNSMRMSFLLQSAGVIGIGLNYMGTCNSKYLEAMLSELMSSSSCNSVTDTDISTGYEIQSVCSGFALGMIALGNGRLHFGKSDIDVVEELVRLVLVRNSGIPSSHTSHHSPIGAIIALMLLFLKSNDKSIADSLHLPQTRHLLDYSRYDIILLKSLGRNLIMWDSIEVTDDWFSFQIPDYMKSLSISSSSAIRKGELLFEEEGTNYLSLESTRHAYLGILAGSCLSLGIKFAGTGCPRAFQAIMRKIRFVSKEIDLKNTSFNARSRRSVARLCHDVMITAAASILAGTGNAELFDYLECLLKTTYANASYGHHAACQLALGILFMGGGLYTFGTSNEAVLGLLFTLYPRFPASPSDNRTHLEALRYMWILAIESRCLITRDIDNRSIVNLPLQISCQLLDSSEYRRYASVNIRNEDTLILTSTPCILPRISTIREVVSDSLNYWGVSIESASLRTQAPFSPIVYYIKRKSPYRNTVF
ncbi:Anaphase-promoting complex subunit 1 [Dinochytrium kinnereticum]|nr:Anaphase-promoting complex subunit 1 [Dinochytrium kinnereticum]